MNIDNNSALFSNDVNGISAMGMGVQHNVSARGASATGISMFQMMMAQLMPGKGQPEAAGDPADMTAQESNGIGQALSELISGGTLAAIRKLNASDELPAGKGHFEEMGPENENGGAVEAVQALMGSLSNAFPVSNIVRVLQENRSGNHPQGLSAIPAGNEGNPVTTGIAPAPPENLQSNFAATGLDETGLVLGDKAAARSIEMAKDRIMLRSDIASKPDADSFADAGRLNGLTESGQLQASGNQSVRGSLEMRDETAVRFSDIVTNQATGARGSQSSGSAGGTVHNLEIDPSELSELAFRNPIQGAAASVETAALNQAAQPAESSETYSQIRDEILSKLEKNGPSEFKMQLVPEDLGQIDVKLRLSEGKLIIDILAANSKTQALLTSQVDKLISGMGLQNVQVESVQVSQQMNSQTQDNGQNQGFSMNAAMDFSQRKSQEQFRQQFANGSPNSAAVSRQGDFTVDTPGTMAIPKGYDSHRMNYTV